MPKIKIMHSEQSSLEEHPINIVCTLLTNLNILEIPIRSLCGGRGNCGTCRVKVIEGGKRMTKPTKQELHLLSKEKLNDGWRLSCQSYCMDGCVIQVPALLSE